MSGSALPATCLGGGALLLLASMPKAFVTPRLHGNANVEPLRATAAAQPLEGVAPMTSSAAGAARLMAGAAGATACVAAGAALEGRRKGKKPQVLAVEALPVHQQYTGPAKIPEQLQYTGGPGVEDVWDPLNLMEGKSEEQILYWRAVELKHSRVAMLAVLGWLHVAAGWHFIGDAAAGFRVSDDPLINVTQLPMGGAWQIVFTILCCEWLTTYVCKPPKDAPWDVFGLRPLVVDTWDFRMSQLNELNNGRLAMVAIIGLIAQDLTTGEYFEEIAKPCFGACNPATWGLGTPDLPDMFYFLDGNLSPDNKFIVAEGKRIYKEKLAAEGAPPNPFEGTPYW